MAIIPVPLANLAVSAVCSALIAMFFDLEKLIEFMSIGTLLAYTIVSASVIILRYKPETTVSLDRGAPEGDDVSISTASTQSDNMELCLAGRLKPKYSWLSHLVGRSGGATSAAVLIFTFVSAAICTQVHICFSDLILGHWWAILCTMLLGSILIACMLIIGAHEQNPVRGTFQVPWVPLVPCLSILSNVALMIHLNPLTWVRFVVWMTLGLLVYFFYGMRHSKEGDLSYSVLMTSSEANKGAWGAVSSAGGDTTVVRVKATQRRSTTDDKAALIDDDE